MCNNNYYYTKIHNIIISIQKRVSIIYYKLYARIVLLEILKLEFEPGHNKNN